MEQFVKLGLVSVDKLAERHFHRIPDRVFASRNSRQQATDSGADDDGSNQALDNEYPVYESRSPRLNRFPEARSQTPQLSSPLSQESSRYPYQSPPEVEMSSYSSPPNAAGHSYRSTGQSSRAQPQKPRPPTLRRASSFSPPRHGSSSASLTRSPTSPLSKHSHSLKASAIGAVAGGFVGQRAERESTDDHHISRSSAWSAGSRFAREKA